jgi:hypothetical protein
MQLRRRGSESGRPGLDGRDLLIAAALFAGVVAYLASLPRSLGWADESFLLYEARRIREGQVMYRDFFEFVSPGAWYVTALLYALFGTTIETARASADVLHGLAAALVYLGCRRLLVGRILGSVAGAAVLLVCQPVWPYASPHWYATTLTLLLLVLLLAVPSRPRPRWPIATGLLSGILIVVQQQKGVYLAAGAGAVFLADHFLAPAADREPIGALLVRLAYLCAGVLAVTLPVFGWLVAVAGPDRLYEALVRYPLVNYRIGYAYRWGEVTPLTRPFANETFPLLLEWLPVALVIPFARVVRGVVRREASRAVRDRIALVVIALSSIASIYYGPDVIHIAFIAGVFFVALADSLEHVFDRLGERVASAACLVLCGLLAIGFAVRLGDHRAKAWKAFPVAYDSAFGRVHLAHPGQGKFIDAIRQRLDASPDRTMFCYHATTAIYLLAGGSNPTRFQLFKPHVNDRSQTDEVLGVLEREKVPYVVTTTRHGPPNEPIERYLREHYDAVPLRHPTLTLLERRGLRPAG